MRRLPLLLLVGCWRGSVEEPRDTAPPDAAPIVAHRKPRPTPEPTPSPAPTPAQSNTTCPSGRGVNARVIGLSATNNHLLVTVAAGTNHGVAANWVASFAQTPATILRVDPQRTVLEMNMLTQQVQAMPNVLLCAP
jgi:hypothetical protein